MNITRPARAASVTMPPYPINFPEDSSGNCFAVVPPATIEWKPEMAPQAIITKSMGQNGPPLLVNETKGGAFIDGLETIKPR